MNGKHLQKLIKLSQRTGDTLIVADPDGDSSVVVMPVERYEDLVMDWDENIYDDHDYDHDCDDEPWEIPDEFLVPEARKGGQEASSQPPDQRQQSVVSAANEREQSERLTEDPTNVFLPEPIIDEITESEIPNLPIEDLDIPENDRFVEASDDKENNNEADGEERFYLEPIE